jgi:hypothetical protein
MRVEYKETYRGRLFLLRLRLLLLLAGLLGGLWCRGGAGIAFHILGLGKRLSGKVFKLCGGRKSGFASFERHRKQLAGPFSQLIGVRHAKTQ